MSEVDNIRQWRDDTRAYLGPKAAGTPAMARAWRRIDALLRDLDRATAIVRDFVDSGAEDIDPRLRYVVAQVDREDWERAVEYVRDQETKT